MTEPELIAKQILSTLQKRKQSAYMKYSEATGDVVLDFSRDVGYLTYEYFDSDNRGRNKNETIRLIKTLKKGSFRVRITDIVKIVASEFTSYIPEKILELVPGKLGKMTGDIFINKVLMQDMTSLLANKLLNRIGVNAIFSTALLLGGARARAIYASQRLFNESPKIYYRLKDSGDLDLLYYIVEDHLEPFIEAISIAKKNPGEFENIVLTVVDGLSQ